MWAVTSVNETVLEPSPVDWGQSVERQVATRFLPVKCQCTSAPCSHQDRVLEARHKLSKACFPSHFT